MCENKKNNKVRPIMESDDSLIAEIIRANLEKFHLDIPGTVYFDPELDHLSAFYRAKPEKRGYFIALDDKGQVIGGVGIAEFCGFDCCAELQKIYLTDTAKGKGMGKYLMQLAEDFARNIGYQRLYLETHTNLETAIRMYEKNGFRQIDKPEAVLHNTMNRFYIKELK
ncbi:MAG: GNAT family N-acetyltransferase [Lachnospiraceae bacterium]|nr:GNAT family N-acetyltransferase [Lachnospiraceae bacterium]